MEVSLASKGLASSLRYFGICLEFKAARLCQTHISTNTVYCFQKVFLDIKPKFSHSSYPLLFDDYLFKIMLSDSDTLVINGKHNF